MAKKAQIDVSLRGARQAAAEARGLTSSLDRLRRSTLAAGKAGGGMSGLSRAILSVDTANGRLSRNLGLTTKALSAVKYAAIGAGAAVTGALTGLAASGVRAGLAYNAMEDRQSIAFETLLGSARKARKMMADIQGLAEKSPILDPANTGLAAQRLLSYGVNAKQVLPLVEAIGDQASASGKSIEEAMGPAALALGQIQSKGKLSAEELGQLAESVGLNRKSLAKNLGMTATELEETFTKGPVSARKALPAILKTLQQTSAGAASKMAATTQGRMDRLGESWATSWSKMTRPVYDFGGRVASMLADGLDVEGGITEKFLGIGAALDKGLGASGQVSAAFDQIVASANSVGQIFTQILAPALTDAWGVLQQLPSPLSLVSDGLKWAAGNADTLKNVVVGLIIAYVGYRTIALAVAAVQSLIIAKTKVMAAIKKVETAAIWAQLYAEAAATKVRNVAALSMAKLRGLHLATRVQLLALTIATKAQTVAQFALNVVMRANPIVLVVTAIAALAAGLVMAYQKVGWFRNAVDTAWGALKTGWAWIKANWPTLLAILTGPIGTAVLIIIKNWDTIKAAATSVYDWVKSKFTSLVDVIKSIPGSIAGVASGMFDSVKEAFRSAINWIIRKWNGIEFRVPEIKALGIKVPGTGSTIGTPDIPEIASGGTVSQAGWHWVGERGPELMRSPAGTEVIDHRTSAQVARRGPATTGPALSGTGGPEVVEVHTHLNADGREIAKLVERHRLRELAVA